jgi:uncharacterized protein (DUF2384 family)
MDSSSTPLANPTAAPNLPMHFGIPFDNPVSFVLFLVCLVSGMCLVYLFCEKKFAERSSTETVDYVDQLLPPHLATREEYTKGFLIYFGLMATSVLVLSLIGPRGLALLGISAAKDIDQAFVPIVVAFLLVGLLGNVPGLLAIENRLRTFAHERAYIPAAARAIAQRLATADFNFSAYGGDVLQEPEMRGVEPADFTRSRCTLEHDWARLACLVYEQKSRRMVGRMDGLDANLLRDYGKDLDSIENAKKSMEPDVALYREKRRNDKFYTDDALRRAIRDNLYKLYILLGCAVRLNQQPHSDIERELNQFGFRVDRVTPPLGKGNGDLNLVGLSIAAVSVLMLGFAGTELGLLGLWTPTFAFPKEHYQPFVDLVSTLIPHVLAIMMADLVRRRAIRKGRWFQRGTHAANYVRVAFVCGLAGYIGLVLWGFAQVEKVTAVGLRIDAPYALLAMATGGFYAYHLDNVEKNRRPSPLWEVGSQAIVTGLCGLVAATVSFDLILGQPLMAIDRIILTAVYGAAVGLVLGWYIPKAAAAKFDPLADSKDERVRTLEIRALAQFGNSTAATNWLDKPNPLLGQKSPRVAAADVDGFERAVTILQGPQELAV